MKTAPKGIALIKKFEGFRDKAYTPVPGDKLTIGYGFVKGVKPGDTMTRSEADVRILLELSVYENAVTDSCTNPPNENEFSAMTSLCFNIGIAGFRKSTVLRCHNAGDHQAAARAFGLWNKSSGVVYPGLTKRRAEEAALYLTPTPDDVSDYVQDGMPQRIDSESSMAASPINQAGVVAGGSAAVGVVAEITRTLADAKTSVQSLGDWLLPALLVGVVVLCGVVVWNRIKQRKQGWA